MQDIFFTQRTTLPTRTPDVLDRNYALLQKAEGYVYQTVNGSDLGAYIFRPREDTPPASGWPVALFFFSSGWDNGLVTQFAPHALYLASRGMMGILIDYRVSSRFPGSTPMDAVADARTAVRWVRGHAAELGVDPQKLVGCGGSAGAHAILSTTLVHNGDGTGDENSASSSPNVFVLFNPILDTGPRSVWGERFPDEKSAKEFNLMRLIRRKLSPMLIIHGSADRVVPFEASVKFRNRNRWRRNSCQLVAYDGHGHGFFNFNFDAQLYEHTLNDLDRFLVERGFLTPNPDDDGVPRLS